MKWDWHVHLHERQIVYVAKDNGDGLGVEGLQDAGHTAKAIRQSTRRFKVA